jgi:hypothetical protein
MIATVQAGLIGSGFVLMLLLVLVGIPLLARIVELRRSA